MALGIGLAAFEVDGKKSKLQWDQTQTKSWGQCSFAYAKHI